MRKKAEKKKGNEVSYVEYSTQLVEQTRVIGYPTCALVAEKSVGSEASASPKKRGQNRSAEETEKVRDAPT